jgi:polyisoprenyl-phosphate glycosyltransferase
MMDADLQHPPSLIGALVGQWEQGYEVVYTVRELTEGAGRWKRLTASLFYRIFRALSGVDLPANAADFRLLDRKVIEAFRQIRERTRFLRGLTSWVGYRSAAISYRASSRVSGQSKYRFRRMLGFGIDGLVSFSATPLYLSIYLGMMLALAGGIYFLYVLYARLIVGDTVPGWTSLIILVMLIGGVQLSLMGIIGVYVGRVYEEAKQRPLYLVDRSVGLEEASPPPDKTLR